MTTLQSSRVPIGSGTQTPYISTAVSKMDSMRALETASTECLLITEELDNGTSSELNTPEVVITNWKFQRQPSHGRNRHATLLNDDIFHADEEPSKAYLDPYSSFASSSQLEQRMNLEPFYSGAADSSGCLPEGSCTGDLVNRYSFMQPEPSFGGAVAEVAFEEQPLECDIFPCIGDKDFKLPSDIERLMEEILPSENENVTHISTEFDMFIGSQDPLAEAINFTGILEDEDPSWSNLDEEVTTVNIDDIELTDKVTTKNMGDIGLSDVVTLSPESTSVYISKPAEVALLPEHGEVPSKPEDPVSVITGARSRHSMKKPKRYLGPVQKMDPEPATTINMGDIGLSDVVTLSPASTTVYISEPAEVPMLPDHEDPVSPTAVTRSKRRVKKPNRYRGAVQDDEDMDVELVEETEPSTSAYNRKPRQSLANLTEEEKYARIRKLNNEASKRCRTNKKKQLENVAKEVDILVKKNERLHKRVRCLESARDQLKDFVHNFFRDQMALVKK